MIINSDAYISERFKFSNTLDPRDFADYQEWEQVISRHLYEWEVEQHNKRDRQLSIQQHATFHTFQAPHIDSNPAHLVYGPVVRVRDQDLPTFCKKYGLSESEMRKVSDGKLLSHKGYIRTSHIGPAYCGSPYRPVQQPDQGEVIRRERSAKQEAQRVEAAKYSVPVASETLTFDPNNPPELPTTNETKSLLSSLKGIF